MTHKIPDPNVVFPNEYKTSCFLKNVVRAANITVGDYTYYDDPRGLLEFERRNALFNYPEFGDRLRPTGLASGSFACLIKPLPKSPAGAAGPPAAGPSGPPWWGLPFGPVGRPGG